MIEKNSLMEKINKSKSTYRVDTEAGRICHSSYIYFINYINSLKSDPLLFDDLSLSDIKDTISTLNKRIKRAELKKLNKIYKFSINSKNILSVFYAKEKKDANELIFSILDKEDNVDFLNSKVEINSVYLTDDEFKNIKFGEINNDSI